MVSASCSVRPMSLLLYLIKGEQKGMIGIEELRASVRLFRVNPILNLKFNTPLAQKDA